MTRRSTTRTRTPMPSPMPSRPAFVAGAVRSDEVGGQRRTVRRRLDSLVLGAWVRAPERGEGVISAAIAVLIMAFLGVGLWIAFHHTLDTATHVVNQQVSKLGN